MKRADFQFFMNKCYYQNFNSPLGKIILSSNGKSLTGLWFEGQKYFKPLEGAEFRELSVFDETKRWLEAYFSAKISLLSLPLPEIELFGSDFQLTVWEILKKIPYGKTLTYKQIADEVAAKSGILKMSAQAVGGAVGRNPISIIVPCHRVIATSGALTGYAGGLYRKEFLLKLEKEGLKNNL